MQAASARLLDLLRAPAWLLGHSQGDLMPLHIADAGPNLVKGLILVELMGAPFQDTVFGSGSARV
jgi:malonyl CoA-acyl carrier protein transacylase